MSPTVHLFCGLPCSGKSTLSKTLEKNHGVWRFNLDEWMMKLYDFRFDQPEYGPAAARVKELIWEICQKALGRGCDVAFDWSLWDPTLRQEWREKAEASGANHVLYYLDTPLNELLERLNKRNAAGAEHTHIIDPDEVVRFSKIFVPPTSNENLNLRVVRDVQCFQL